MILCIISTIVICIIHAKIIAAIFLMGYFFAHMSIRYIFCAINCSKISKINMLQMWLKCNMLKQVNLIKQYEFGGMTFSQYLVYYILRFTIHLLLNSTRYTKYIITDGSKIGDAFLSGIMNLHFISYITRKSF